MKAISSDRQSCLNRIVLATLMFVIIGLFRIPAYAKGFCATLTELITDPSGTVIHTAAVTAVIGTMPGSQHPMLLRVTMETYRSKRGGSSAHEDQSAIVTTS